jgi:phosphate transport system substrate-binding protein
MNCFGGLMVLLLATAAMGQEGPFPKTGKVEEALKELDQMPVAAEYQRQSKVISDLQEGQRKKVQVLYEKLQKLCDSPAYKEYLKKRQALESQRSSAWEVERKVMAEEARKIYAARHEEIRRLAKATLSDAKKLGLDVLNYPKVDGSTSTGPLSVIIASRILGTPYEWVYPEPTGQPWRDRRDLSASFLPAAARLQPRDVEFSLATLQVVAKPTTKGRDRVAMMINSLLAASTSTHDAYVNIIEGRSDLDLAARPPSQSELKLAKEKGVTIQLEPIARDAFVLLVNLKNPVEGLTRKQVREIYEEKITDWSAVGGKAGKIQAFRRERDSGSRELFDALVMQGQALPEGDRFNELYANSMMGPYNQVTERPEGLGYSIYYYEHFMAASPATRVLAIDGVAPTLETIASGKYPWVTRVYVAYRAGAKENSPAMKLLRWMTSEEGQEVVRESGYVPEK